MLDAGFVRDNADLVKANNANRNAPAFPVDRVVAFEEERKRLTTLRSETAGKQNQISAGFAKASPEERAKLKEQSTTLKNELVTIDAQLKLVEDDLKSNLLLIPNLTHPDAPVSADATGNVVVTKWGEPKRFDFKPQDHVALCESLDLCDFEAGTRVAGQKFYFLKNEGALLELAIVQYAVQTAMRHGFTPMVTPDLARVEVMEGTGYMPRNPDPTKREFYQIADSDLCLIATAEITIGGMHKDRVFDEAELPKKYVGLSHCFRTEAGAAGRDTRGLYRVHQFTKIEMFGFCTPGQSEGIHREILAVEEELFQGLGLAYQVIDTCTGDLGGPAYRKYDLEAWMPCRGTAGEYGEVTSTSNCTDYQARRLGIRYRPADKKGKGNPHVHTLNGTAIACTRAIVAILENYQQADGSVVVPEVLRPWVGKDVITCRKGK